MTHTELTTRSVGLRGYLDGVSRMMLQSRQRASSTSYNSLEQLVAECGVEFKTIANMATSDVRIGRQGCCFMNAAQIAIQDNRFAYCEGFALSGIPMLHAWLTDKHGAVYDVTHGWFGNCVDYIGLVISHEHLAKTILTRGLYGVLDDYQHRFPMLSLEREAWEHSFAVNIRRQLNNKKSHGRNLQTNTQGRRRALHKR